MLVAHDVGVDLFRKGVKRVAHAQKVAVQSLDHLEDVRDLRLHFELSDRFDHPVSERPNTFVDRLFLALESCHAFFDVRVGVVDKFLEGVDQQLETAFRGRNAPDVLRRHEADRLEGARREFVDRLAVALGKTADDVARVTPLRDAPRSRLPRDGFDRSPVHQTGEPIDQHRLGKRALVVKKQRLQKGDGFGSRVGRKQRPGRRAPQFAVALDGSVDAPAQRPFARRFG